MRIRATARPPQFLPPHGAGVAVECFLIGFGVFAFAACGHLLWWIGATLLRAAFPDRPPLSAQPLDTCPSCSAPARSSDWFCLQCGLRLDSPQARRLARVRAAEAEIRSLADAGTLDPDAARLVAAQLARRAEQLHPPRAEVVAIPAPVAPPPVEPAPVPEIIPDEPPPEPPAPVPPQERWTFASFMEERNILWGELVGGLLIVGCSIALVFTFWQRLEAVPYFPFLLSATATLALYGAGQYTLHHWKLTSTSRGLLVIALLLVPLDLLLLSDAATGAAAVRVAAVALFVWVVRGGGRDLLPARPAWRWPLAVAVVGAPAAVLLPAAWLALVCFLGGTLVALRAAPRDGEVEHDAGAGLLQFVGLAGFALAAAWGLHLAKSPDAAGRVRELALPLVLAAVPVVECGLLVLRRATGGGLRTAGTGVALAGFVAMTGALAAAWPGPAAVLAVSAVAGVFLTRVAIRDAVPWAHAGAIPMLALAVVVTALGAADRWGEPLARSLSSADSGVALAAFALVLAAVGEWFARRGVRPQAVSYAVGGAGVGLVALFVATLTGPESPARAAVVHLACAVGLLAANGRWRLRVAAHGGLWLALVGTLWAMHAAYPGQLGLWGFAAAAESLGFALLALRLPRRTLLRAAGRDVSLAAGIVALALTFSNFAAATSPWATATLFTLAPAGLALARLTAFPVFTFAASAAAGFGFVRLAAGEAEWEPPPQALLVGALSHVSLAVLAAVLLRRREWLFAQPLRVTAALSTLVAAVLLLIPPAAHLTAWAGCAAWLGAVWLVAARAWRDAAAFAGFQAAFTLAVILAAAARVDDGAFARPASLHAYGAAVGWLSLAWVVLRRLARSNAVACDLWTGRAWSTDRVALAVVVVTQFVALGLGVVSAAQGELNPAVSEFRDPLGLARWFGPSAWALVGVLLLAVGASWRWTGGAGDTDAHGFGVAVLLLSVPLALAGSHALDGTASLALRWNLATAFVVGTVLFAARGPVRQVAAALGVPVHPTSTTRPAALALLAVTAAVAVLVTASAAEVTLTERRAVGVPLDAVGPLLLVAVGLALSAARERSAGYAFAGGLAFTAAVAGGRALASPVLDAVVRTQVGLLVAGSAAAWACLWLAAERRVRGGALLADQVRIGLFILAAGAGATAVFIVTDPTASNDAIAAFGRYGWAALAVSCAAAVWHARRTEPRLLFHALALSAAVAGVLAAAAVPHVEWRPFHALAVAWAAVGVGLTVAARRRGESSWWLDGFAVAFVLLAVRGGDSDPWRPWLPAGLAAAAAWVVGAAAVVGRSGARAVASVVFVNIAAVLLWLPTIQSVSGLFLANAAGLAVGAAAWAAVRRRDPDAAPEALLDLARAGALALLALGLTPTLGGDRGDSAWLTWGATAAVAAAAWVGRGRATLFGAGVAAVLLIVTANTTRPVWDVPITPVALAAFAVAARLTPTMRASQSLLAVGVLVLGARVGLTAPELSERCAFPVAVALLAIAWVTVPRAAALLALGVPVALAWAGPVPWLDRTAWLVAALAGAAWVGVALAKRPAFRAAGGWAAGLAVVALLVNLTLQVPVFDPITRRTPLAPPAVFAELAAIVVLGVLAIRFALHRNLDPLDLPDTRRTAYVYLAELLAVLFFTHVRFNVPELFLGAAVRYWTFAVMGLAFVGVGAAEFFERRRVSVLSVPLRRTGVLLPLIPLLAFWAKPPAALAEFAAGRAPGLSPFLGYLDKLPQHFDTYAGLWFLAGGVYGLVAVWRKSFGWALLAALATNAATWALLAHHQVPFVVHPQAWVIPLALIVLASEHVNRSRLREDVSNGLRHLGVLMIYVSSAADMFVAGVGSSVWLPVVLAVFCVAGVLFGIAARVRSFIYLGVAFLALDVFAMIWHAAVNLQQTWVWYASGIVLGVAILVLFAVFERNKTRRDEGVR